MPPQQPGPGDIPDFDPTQDIPDFDPAADIPDYDPNEGQPSKGRFVKRSPFYTEWVPEGESDLERQVTGKPKFDINQRPDTAIVGGVPEIFERMRQSISTRAATSPNIPDWLRPQAAIVASQMLEVPRFFAEAFSQPEGILAPGFVKGLTRKKPPIKPAPKLLPPGKDPYIGGPTGASGQVVKESEILPELRPQAEARLAAPSDLLETKEPAARFTDLDELREAERLRNVYYTKFEQEGGKALEVPGDPERYLRGTELGFDEVARTGGLPYPEDFMPESVRPRAAQEVSRALSPRRMQEQTPFDPNVPPLVSGTVKPVPPTKPSPTPDMRGGTAAIRPGEKILPSAPARLKNQAKQNSGLNIKSDTVSKAPAELQPALAATIIDEAKNPSWWRATRDVLRKVSPDLARRDERANQIIRQYGAQWIPKFEAATKKLTKTQKANFGGYVEGSIPITDARVLRAVQAWKVIENEIGDEATKLGLRLYISNKNYIPFQKHPENYWPHIPTEKLNRDTLVDRLIAKGMTRAEADKVKARYMREGELVIGPQYARNVKSDIPYRLDADAAIQHVRAMSRRMAWHREFGPRDIAGKGAEGISDLIEASANPTMAKKIMQRLLDREEKSDPKLAKWLDRARRYAAVTKLQNFTIPNMILGQMTTAQKASRYPVQALKEMTKLISKRYRTELAKSGIWQNLNFTMAEEMGRIDPYLIGAGEVFNRGIAGAVGKAVARSAHKALRSNPLSKADRNDLSELVLEDIDSLIRQSELTNTQLNMAAGRMAEITQGLNIPGNLPYWMSEPVTNPQTFAGQLALIFKKMAYQATRTVWKTLDPKTVGPVQAAKNAALWVTLTQIGGELTGDVKAGIKGMWTDAGPEEEMAKRGDWWLEGNGISPTMINEVADISGIPPEVIARVIDNAAQSFMLGLPADLAMSSAFGPEGLISAIAGPVIGDISKYSHRLVTADWQGIIEEMLKGTPIPGAREIPDVVFPPEEEGLD